MFLTMPVVQKLLQIRMFTGSICIQVGTLSLSLFVVLFVNFKMLLSHARHCFSCNGMTGYLDSSPSPRQSIVPDPAPIIRYSKSTIMAALYTIMVTLIKVPSPDPFPGWNILPLLQSWDNGPCYMREQGPTVSRLRAYSPGLIIQTLWGTVLLGKAPSSGGPCGELKFPCCCRDRHPHTRSDGKTMTNVQKVNIICRTALVSLKCIHGMHLILLLQATQLNAKFMEISTSSK